MSRTGSRSPSGSTTPVAPLSSPSTTSLRSDDGLSLDTLASSLAASIVRDAEDDDAKEPYYVSEREGSLYYYGLRSRPKLLYRSDYDQKWLGTLSVPGYASYETPASRRLLPVFDHVLNDIWETEVAAKVIEILDTQKVRFNTIDVVRLETVGEDGQAPLILWVGIVPGPPSYPRAMHEAAQAVLRLLPRYGITDCGVQFREHKCGNLAGAALLSPVPMPKARSTITVESHAKVVGPFTPLLGVRIASAKTPHIEGTMGLYLVSKSTKKLYGLTCCHVVMGVDHVSDDFVYHKHGPKQAMIHLGDHAFSRATDAVQKEIETHHNSIEHYREKIAILERRENGPEQSDEERQKVEDDLDETRAFLRATERAVRDLTSTHKRVLNEWRRPADRVIGKTVLAPATEWGIGAKNYIEDWSLIELDKTRLGKGFLGNVIDLSGGGQIPRDTFIQRCFPTTDADWSFKYPPDGQLHLQGVLSDDQMRHPTMRDSKGLPCLFVVKNGNTSGVTLGRATGVKSVARKHPLHESARQTGFAWSILGYDKTEDFSAKGDSGSVIADIQGRIGGLLFYGGPEDGDSDVTYAIPFWWLLQRIQERSKSKSLGEMSWAVSRSE